MQGSFGQSASSDAPGDSVERPMKAARQLRLSDLLKPGNAGVSAASCVRESDMQWTDLGNGSRVGYWPRALSKSEHDRLLQTLRGEVPWRTGSVLMVGKRMLQPRMFCYMADDTSQGYSYAGLDMVVEAWHPAILPFKERAERSCNTRFNSCLLNLYRDGSDNVGWHSDDETLYGKGSTICSLSLGQARDFQIREKHGAKRKMSWCLGDGDMFVMAGTLQSLWQHQVPKRANVWQARISLTFRTVKFAQKHAKG